MVFEKWKKLIASEDSGDRSHAADMIPEGATHEEVAPYLIAALHDSDALVRTCAADSLGYIRLEVAQEALRTAAKIEEDILTKSYVLSSLGAVGDENDLAVLIEALKNETDPRIRLSAALGLAFCASDIAIGRILSEIENGEPLNETAANVFGEYVDAFQSQATTAVEVVKEQLNKDSLSPSERACFSALYKRLNKIAAE